MCVSFSSFSQSYPVPKTPVRCRALFLPCDLYGSGNRSDRLASANTESHPASLNRKRQCAFRQFRTSSKQGSSRTSSHSFSIVTEELVAFAGADRASTGDGRNEGLSRRNCTRHFANGQAASAAASTASKQKRRVVHNLLMYFF